MVIKEILRKNQKSNLKTIRRFPPENASKTTFSKFVIFTKTVSGWMQLLERKDSPRRMTISWRNPNRKKLTFLIKHNNNNNKEKNLTRFCIPFINLFWITTAEGGTHDLLMELNSPRLLFLLISNFFLSKEKMTSWFI